MGASLAFLIDQLFSSTPGGIGTYVRQLVPAMARADPDLDVTLFHAHFEGNGSASAEGEVTDREPWMKAFTVEALPQPISRLYPRWSVARRPPLPASLSSRNLLHSPSPAAVPPPGSGQRLIVTIHDLAFVVHPQLFPPRWRAMYRIALARAVRSADAILTVSRHTAEDLFRKTRVDQRRVHVVPLAASMPSSEIPVEEALDRLKIPRPYVLYVGTLEPRKNLVRLVRAYRRGAGRGAPHALVLAGPIGWHHQELMREIEREGPGDVVLTGSLDLARLDALYRGATAFVYPSIYEGFGLPVLEAMARGVPCVVSTSSSLPEVAGEAAVPVDPRSMTSVADALERVLNDADLRERLRLAGMARAAGFSWEATATRTLAVYRSLL